MAQPDIMPGYAIEKAASMVNVPVGVAQTCDGARCQAAAVAGVGNALAGRRSVRWQAVVQATEQAVEQVTLREDPGAGDLAQAGEAGDDLRVGVLGTVSMIVSGWLPCTQVPVPVGVGL